MFKLGAKSRQKLEGVHPDLVRVVVRALEISEIDFTVLEGLRTLERQKKLLDMGASTTLKSRHLTGHAVDIAPWFDFDGDGDIDSDDMWRHWCLYEKLAAAMKGAADELQIPIEWGGDWTSFKDGPHFQLPWAQYPA